jgi:hypothetical protein
MNCKTHGLLSKSTARNVLGEKVLYKLLSNFTEESLIVQCRTYMRMKIWLHLQTSLGFKNVNNRGVQARVM